MTDTIPTQNEPFGFYGTIAQAGLDQEARLRAWAEAFRQIQLATDADPYAVRAFLDSRYGRHFADQVGSLIKTDGMMASKAIERVVAHWMSRTTGPADEHYDGIPEGLPQLTGYVQHASIEAEAE